MSWIIAIASGLAGMLIGGVLVILFATPSGDSTSSTPQQAPTMRQAMDPEPPPQPPLVDRDSSTVPQTVAEPAPAVTAGAPPSTQLAPGGAPPMPAEPIVARPSMSRPPAQRTRIEAAITDEQIEQSIRGGVEYLLEHFDDPAWLQGLRDQYAVGVNSLCIHALLQCGQTISDERLNVHGKFMRDLLTHMRQFPMSGPEQTYARSIRAAALAMHNRPEDRPVLRADITWLLNAAKTGGYTYTNDDRDPDNSNSQYGVLGVWAGAEAGMEVPPAYWAQVRRHWVNCQHPTGLWGYTPGRRDDPSLAMTAAGLTSLFVVHDHLEAPAFGKDVGRPPFPQAIADALAWLEQGDNCLQIQGRYPTYTLYSLERVGLASGFKYFGRHDWYPELAQILLDRQIPLTFERDARKITACCWNVSANLISSDLIDTAFSLLFLARGRHPLLINKLRFDGYWANRPRDVANLTRFASQELERPLNWQVVPLNRPWHDWMDCPLLYLASHEPPNLSENDRIKLRRFAEAGGMIFTQADGDSEPFTRFITELGQTLFPDYQWKDLPLDHPIYTVHYKVQDPPPFRYLSNGVRILMLHSPRDLARTWQLRAERSRRSIYELGVNLFIYAAGKTDLRNRLSSLYLPHPSQDPTFRIQMARVRYSGSWDPEPYAFTRFARWLEYQSGYRLVPTTVGAEYLKPDTWPVAHLTGTDRYTLSDDQVTTLRQYVEEGGVLLIDACGGSSEFDQSSRAMLQQAFPQARLSAIPPTHPLLIASGNGMDPLPKPLLRTGAPSADAPIQILSSGKGHVIYSPLDLTTGLLGTNTWGINGYRPAYAQSLLKNILLWAVDGAPGTGR